MKVLLTETGLNDIYFEWVEMFGNGRDENDYRFGQFIFNNFIEGDGTLSNLFYEESVDAAHAIVLALIQGQK
jgi:hypothetical protein